MDDWFCCCQSRLIGQAAAFITAAAYNAAGNNGCFTLVLSGGRTPGRLYERLACGVEEKVMELYGHVVPEGACRNSGEPSKILLPWHRTFLFWGDERYLPHGHQDSNFRMARETLIRHVAIPAGNIYPVPVGSGNPEKDAAAYESMIRRFFSRLSEGTVTDFPSFDLAILGMGADGHIASLFPEDAKALGERKRWVLAVTAPDATPAVPRISMTLPLINHSRRIMFLVPPGRDALARLVHEGRRPDLPAGMVRPLLERPVWFVLSLAADHP